MLESPLVRFTLAVTVVGAFCAALVLIEVLTRVVLN